MQWYKNSVRCEMKDHVTLTTGLMADENSASDHRNTF